MTNAAVGDETHEISPAIAQLLARGGGEEGIGELLDTRPTPLVEGPSNTFLWRGQADGVAVEHRVAGITAPLPMQRLHGSDLWHATVQLPHGSRVEYRLLIRRGDSVESILDPRNPLVARGPLSEMSELRADGYTVPEWTEHDPEAALGQLTEVRLKSRALRRIVPVTLYTPARLRPERRHPLLIVHDGGDFLGYSAFGTVLDNLMHRRLMADTVVAFTHPKDRMREYTARPAHSRFLNDELVPELERTLPVRGGPRSRVLLGASLGAAASLAAAMRTPGMYGGLFLLSGSFRSSLLEVQRAGMPMLRSVARFVRALHHDPHPVTDRIFQTYGAFEPLADVNRALTPVLRHLAHEVRVTEALDGHTWTGWRDQLLDGLSFLLPPEPAAEAGS